MPLTPEQELARTTAVALRERRRNPLPSRMDGKIPWMAPNAPPWDHEAHRYAHLWDRMAPDELFTPEGWPPTQNLQLMTGVRWSLIAFDLDGQPAIDEWARMCRGRYVPNTWVTHSGGGGRHVWFVLPEGYDRPTPKAEIWRADPSKPRVKGEPAIERLCDKSLVMFPPSIHPRTGREYVFGNPRHRPPKMSLPAECPWWILDLKPLKPAFKPAEFVPPPPKLRTRAVAPETFLSNDELKGRIPDKIGLLRDLGVRFTGRVSPTGWAECRAIDRPDDNPSAAVHVDSGVYTDRGSGGSMNFFDFYATLRGLPSWREAKDEIAAVIR